MRENYSFRTRLLLSFWVLLLVALLLPSYYYYHILSRKVLEDSQASAFNQLNLVQWLLEREKDLRSVDDLQTSLTDLGRRLNARITYVAEGGRVIADSQIPAAEIPNLENHANRPEIIQTQTQGFGSVIRFSGTTQTDLMYVAKRVGRRADIPAGVLRLAAPLSEIREPLEGLKDSFLVFLALVAITTATVSFLLIRRLNRPIRAMIEAAEAISSRDYKKRIRSSPGQEFHPLAQSINRMAESIQNQIQTVTDQKQELEAVFDAMQEGVMVLDSRGKIKTVNRTFAELASRTSEVVGRRPLEVIPDPELQKVCDRGTSAHVEGFDAKPHNLQIVLGDECTYDVNIVWLPEQQGKMGAVVVFHDITELKRLEKVRQDFVANVSHELRTPLTSIKGFTETLLSETQPDPETAVSFLNVILRNTNHMVKMVEDLLQLARLEAPSNPLRMVPVNAASALSVAWKACSHHAEGKRIALENQLPGEGIWGFADFDQLVQVFRNLLENAIRYSPPGEPITVSGRAGGEDVILSVRDRGPGIARQHQQRIFERFYRIEKHRSDHWGSTGLGLAICRHILRNHGGRIWVQSPNGESANGSAFFFTLRKAEPPPPGMEEK